MPRKITRQGHIYISAMDLPTVLNIIGDVIIFFNVTFYLYPPLHMCTKLLSIM